MVSYLSNKSFVKDCEFTELVGDGYCHDETNNLHCDFDGGDCCYSCVNHAFCLECQCLTGNDGAEINKFSKNPAV